MLIYHGIPIRKKSPKKTNPSFLGIGDPEFSTDSFATIPGKGDWAPGMFQAFPKALRKSLKRSPENFPCKRWPWMLLGGTSQGSVQAMEI